MDSDDLPKKVVVWEGEPQLICLRKVQIINKKEPTISDYSDIEIVE